jgi:hypothetical protein
VFSVRIKSVVVAAKNAAAHHAGNRFQRLVTACGPIASIERLNREF